MTAPLHSVARALGVEAGGGCGCAVCGSSPFDAAGRKRQVLGVGFSQHETLLSPRHDAVCLGCKAVLGGRPGRQPPPLRMVSFRIDMPPAAPEIQPLNQADWQPLLAAGPPPGGAVVSWARSKKKHHALSAGVSADGVWRIGSDDGRIDAPHSPELMRAVISLRRLGASKTAILTGVHAPGTAARPGFARNDEIVRPHRGGAWLELVVYACAEERGKNQGDEKPMLTEIEKKAVGLLADIAGGSALRREDGIRFWGGFFAGRVSRFAQTADIKEFVSRLGDECRTDISAMAAAARKAALEWPDEDGPQVLEAMRKRGAILQALAFESLRNARAKNTEK